MAPPIYSDLGKAARDLLLVGYHPGLWQLDCKTMTKSGIEFFTTGFANTDASKVMASLQSKYKLEDYGITLTERWNTNNLLYGQIMQKDKLAEGLMGAVEASIRPATSDKSAKFLVNYVRDNYNIMGKIGIGGDTAAYGGSLVLSHDALIGGLALEYTNDLTWKVALGWSNDKTIVHGELINAKGWLASLFHKLNEKCDLGFEIGQAAPSGREPEAEEAQPSDLGVTLGMVYHLDGDALIRAKVNNKVELGLGYQQKLREGITMSVSTILDCRNLTDGRHKFGIGLSLQC